MYYMDMDIPENNFSQLKEIKVVKLNTPSSTPVSSPPSTPPVPSIQSKIIRNPIQKPAITYDDIMNKMGMRVIDGKLHFIGEYLQKNQKKETNQNQYQYQNQNQSQRTQRLPKQEPKVPIEVAPQNSYIYNKYFKDELKETPELRVPKNAIEYRNMLIQDIIQRERIRRVKSKQLFVTNIDNTIAQQPRMSEQQLNKLFAFSNTHK